MCKFSLLLAVSRPHDCRMITILLSVIKVSLRCFQSRQADAIGLPSTTTNGERNRATSIAYHGGLAV
jgi:hypothetical protein